MAKSKAPNVDWHLLPLERLEQHLTDLRSVGLRPTAAFTAALRAARSKAREDEELNGRTG